MKEIGITWKGIVSAALAGMLLFGCASPERGTKPSARLQQLQLGDGFVLDYQVDTRVSKIDGSSCYMFVTGTLSNAGERKLLRHSRLSLKVYSGDAVVFSDVSQPRMDVLPGSRVQIDLIESPVFKRHCPSFDRVEASLLRLY